MVHGLLMRAELMTVSKLEKGGNHKERHSVEVLKCSVHAEEPLGMPWPILTGLLHDMAAFI